MSIAERIASEKEPEQAVDAEHKFAIKTDLSPAIYGNERLN
jgi:hypothetical protein